MKIEKKLYRSTDDYMIAGVCGGIAEYFEIDSVLIRIIFIVLSLAGGSGLIIYILMLLLLPAKGETIKIKSNEIKKEIKMKRDGGKSFLGIIFLVVGSILLWNQFFPYTIRFEIFWPATMIILGLWMLLKK
jgi:phage shock protein PspC (stress-responsive transcriptional regulator)